ncbi:hypothetical protein CM49_02135 [Paenibacillus sp. P1XP2]|nr:hypothetical protein CM49_02135 [Paenibacillus sp. P1XP2]
MTGMMTHPVSYGSLKRMTLRDAEEALFGGGCEAYFQSNYVQETELRLKQLQAGEGWGNGSAAVCASSRPWGFSGSRYGRTKKTAAACWRRYGAASAIWRDT